MVHHCLAGFFALGGLAAQAHAAFNYFDPTDTARVPGRLSETGLYSDVAAKAVTPEAVYYEVNSAHWQDGAFARRWILLRPGKSIPYSEGSDFFNYPDSTVFAQSFLLEKRAGDSTTRTHWETRLLVKKAGAGTGNDWYGFSYRWNAAQSEAHLVARDPFVGFDTAFLHRDAQGRHAYKKWRFPSSFECGRCHRSGAGQDSLGGNLAGRTVLGFFPAQLKRPSIRSPGMNQVLDLFDQGVFAGIRPGLAELGRRFKGLDEVLPASGDARFRVLDTLARSYLAANCSGCHGNRGKVLGGSDLPSLDLDFHALVPAQELGRSKVAAEGLNDTAHFDPLRRPEGQTYYALAVRQAGFNSGPGAIWDMALPPFQSPQDLEEAAVYPGYPSLSVLLFKLWARAAPWTDSARTFRRLTSLAQSGDSATEAMARERLSWIFSAGWGSEAWLDSLAAHGLSLDSVTDGYAWESDTPKQMPPMASSFLPDTAALRLLGEWVKSYRSGSIAKIRRVESLGPPQPMLRGRILYWPMGGKPALWDLYGKKMDLKPLGSHAYTLPAGLPPGIYLFRAGDRIFRTALTAP